MVKEDLLYLPVILVFVFWLEECDEMEENRVKCDEVLLFGRIAQEYLFV